MSNVIRDNLRALLVKFDTTQSALASVADVTQGSVSLWLSGKTEPRGSAADKIIDYYGLTRDDLYSDTRGLYARYYGLTDAPEGARAVSDMPAHGVRFADTQMLGYVHAGGTDTAWTLDDGTAPLYTELAARHPQAFALLVNGDCMDDAFGSGSVIFVDPAMEPRDGAFVVVEIDGECVVRELKLGSTSAMLVSRSSSGHYEDIVLTRSEFSQARVQGVVFWYQSADELG